MAPVWLLRGSLPALPESLRDSLSLSLSLSLVIDESSIDTVSGYTRDTPLVYPWQEPFGVSSPPGCLGFAWGEKGSSLLRAEIPRIFSALFGPFHSSAGITSGRGTHQGCTRDTPGVSSGFPRFRLGLSGLRATSPTSKSRRSIPAGKRREHSCRVQYLRKYLHYAQ